MLAAMKRIWAARNISECGRMRFIGQPRRSPHLLCGQGTNRKLTEGVQTAQTARGLRWAQERELPPPCLAAATRSILVGCRRWRAAPMPQTTGRAASPFGRSNRCLRCGAVPRLSHDLPRTFPGPSRDLPEAVAVSILRIRPYAPGGPSPGSGAKASGRHGCLGQSDPIGDAQRNGRIVEVVTGIVQPRADAVAQHDEGAGSIAEHV